MKIQTALTLGLFVVIIAIILVSKYHQQPDYSPAIASKNKIIDSLAKSNIVLQLERNAYKMEAQSHRKKAEETGKELAIVKKERDYLKGLKPVTQKDSLTKYVLLDANCDSLLITQAAQSGQYQQEADMWHRSSDKADTLIYNLQAEVKLRGQVDSLHVTLLNEALKDGKRKQLKGILIGVAIAILGLLI
jgi:hypothetical protein